VLKLYKFNNRPMMGRVGWIFYCRDFSTEDHPEGLR